MTEPFRTLRRAGRSLAQAPVPSLLVVLILALGIGATTALYSVVDALLLSPLPYPEPERLVRVYETFQHPGGTGLGSVSVPNFRDWREQAGAFEELAAYTRSSPNLQGVEEPERLRGVAASANLFDLLGVPARIGRTFAVGEDQPGAPPVVVLSHGLWERRLGADPEAVGRTMVLDGEAHTVVGVMPEGFAFPPGSGGSDGVELWLPLVPDPELAEGRGRHWMFVVGRLAPEATLETARTEMTEVARRLEEAHPGPQAGRSAEVLSLQEVVVGRVRPALLILLGGTGLVLLIACANAVNLLLVRSAGRRREVAIQAALGAGRGRLLAEFTAEAALLVAAASAAGLLAAWGGVRFLVRLAGDQLPRAAEVGFDGGVFAFVLAVSVPVAVALGLVPAFQAASGRLHALLKEGDGRTGSGRVGRRFRSGLVAAQIALSVVLLLGAGLLGKTFLALLDTETGMVTEDVLTLRVALPEGRYAEDRAVAEFYEPVRRRVESLPGVTSAGWITALPLQEWGINGGFGIAGRPDPQRPEDVPFAEFRAVSPGYFGALGIPLLRGRDLAPEDGDFEHPVLVVNRALAEKYFPESGGVGERLRFGDVEVEVVGVVGDVRGATLDRPPQPELYFPYFLEQPSSMSLVVRGGVAPETLAGPVAAAVREVDPEQPVYAVQSMAAVVSRSIADRKLYLWLLGVFAAVALVLTVAGVYGLVSSAVAQRRREIGIRVALGARPREVMALLVGHGARLALAGLLVGVPGALAAGRLLRGLLYGVEAGDPGTVAGVAGLLFAVTVAATWAPARRAREVDPVETLRAD